MKTKKLRNKKKTLAKNLKVKKETSKLHKNTTIKNTLTKQ